MSVMRGEEASGMKLPDVAVFAPFLSARPLLSCHWSIVALFVCRCSEKQTNKTKRLRTARPLLGWTPPALTPSPCPTSGLVCLLSETVYSSRRSDFSVASARNACSWVMFVFHSSRCWSSVRSSVVRCCRRSSVVLSSVVRLVVAVGRLVVGCRLSVVVVVRQSLVVGCLVGRPSSVVGFPFPVLRLPNCRGTLSPTAFHHGRPVCLLPPPGLLTVSQFSSSQLQLTLPTTVRGVSPAPPFGFRLLASARRLPPLGPLRSSTSPPRLRGSLLLLGLPQASRDRLVPSCPRRLAGLGRPLSGLSRAIPSGRLASPEGFLLYEFRSSGSFPRFLLGPFWVP